MRGGFWQRLVLTDKLSVDFCDLILVSAGTRLSEESTDLTRGGLLSFEEAKRCLCRTIGVAGGPQLVIFGFLPGILVARFSLLRRLYGRARGS